jgi:uncharacterized RDD family membrane protein YckC
MQDQHPGSYPKSAAKKVKNTELAPLGMRFLGFLIDWLILGALFFLIMYLSGSINFDELATREKSDVYEAVKNNTMSAVLIMMIQAYFLYTSGQTIGKKLLGMRIVTADNEKPSFIKLILLRYGLIGFISGIPLVMILDAIFIFVGTERRCLHDYLSGTKVVVDN